MLAESAVCVVFDDHAPTAGRVTTATAMGESLLRRVIDAGRSFTVITESPVSRKYRVGIRGLRPGPRLAALLVAASRVRGPWQ